MVSRSVSKRASCALTKRNDINARSTLNVIYALNACNGTHPRMGIPKVKMKDLTTRVFLESYLNFARFNAVTYRADPLRGGVFCRTRGGVMSGVWFVRVAAGTWWSPVFRGSGGVVGSNEAWWRKNFPYGNTMGSADSEIWTGLAGKSSPLAIAFGDVSDPHVGLVPDVEMGAWSRSLFEDHKKKKKIGPLCCWEDGQPTVWCATVVPVSNIGRCVFAVRALEPAGGAHPAIPGDDLLGC